jgi:hypothetical protein
VEQTGQHDVNAQEDVDRIKIAPHQSKQLEDCQQVISVFTQKYPYLKLQTE